MEWLKKIQEQPSVLEPVENAENADSQQVDTTKRRSSTSSRPGKFTDLSQFASPQNPEDPGAILHELEHNPVASSGIVSPQIIHIKDEDPTSRIHDRIMLAIRNTSTTSLTCLSFCIHQGSIVHKTHCEDHAKLISGWNATTETALPSSLPSSSSPISLGHESEYFTLHVTLESAGCKLKPNENVYINLKELWNIETASGVEFAILGQATHRHWQAAQEKIIDVFSSTVRGSDKRHLSPLDPGKILVVEGEKQKEQKEHKETKRSRDSKAPKESDREGRRKGSGGARHRTTEWYWR
ncbi:hypothetical protein BKA64DRAFT_474115 [Cadophora sp. MPI-SDFR-AT-0126]|nr:hypothetical protein BKA64DRAFT_474115 [Leotiomycetes sp. MPI-SDFR-AT-0126]